MSRSRSTDNPYRDDTRSAPKKSSSSHTRVVRQGAQKHTEAREAAPAKSGRSRRRRGAGAYAAPLQLTSHPTSRNAYAETRVWLLERHGPICAYCGTRFTERVMTLDHVAPRRGRTAYDRRDNLVLACKGCNAAKRDLAPIAFLLANRVRAVNLLRYGAHLSPMLVELAQSIAPAGSVKEEVRKEFSAWAALDDSEDQSPYAD